MSASNKQPQSLNDEDDTNTKISYQKMTSSKDTILVMMDKMEYLLQQGIRAVKSAQAVD